MPKFSSIAKYWFKKKNFPLVLIWKEIDVLYDFNISASHLLLHSVLLFINILNYKGVKT